MLVKRSPATGGQRSRTPDAVRGGRQQQQQQQPGTRSFKLPASVMDGVKDAPARVRAGTPGIPRPRSVPADEAATFAEELSRIGILTASPTPFRRVVPTLQQHPSRTASPSPTPQSSAVGRAIHVPYRPDLRAKQSATLTVNTHVSQKPMTFRDLQTLAETSQRAGRARLEGHAYYKMGELLAQKRETLERSIQFFRSYLGICRRLNDLQGEAKALNCLGIVHQELGEDDDLEKALQYHQQHSDIADAAGVFIANTNMGLVSGLRGDAAQSIAHHKQALQFAVRAQDKQAEALALANLSLMGRAQGDHTTAKVCIERNLELCNTLNDGQASTDAYEQLGLLSSDKHDWAAASDFLLQALDLSAKQGNREKTNAIRCKIGYVNGTMRMDEHFRSVAKMMGARNEKKKRKSGQEP